MACGWSHASYPQAMLWMLWLTATNIRRTDLDWTCALAPEEIACDWRSSLTWNAHFSIVKNAGLTLRGARLKFFYIHNYWAWLLWQNVYTWSLLLTVSIMMAGQIFESFVAAHVECSLGGSIWRWFHLTPEAVEYALLDTVVVRTPRMLGYKLHGIALAPWRWWMTSNFDTVPMLFT